MNLCDFIEASGYKVVQVADMAGIAQASLIRYMNGQSPLPLDAMKPLAEVLGRDSIDDFINLSPPRQKTKDELEAAQPMFARARPGFEPTEEDLADFADAMRKIQARRDKKRPKR